MKQPEITNQRSRNNSRQRNACLDGIHCEIRGSENHMINDIDSNITEIHGLHPCC